MNNYLKAIIIGLSAFALAACGNSVEERQATKTQINEQLPDGCQFNYYGTYLTDFNEIHVGAVLCDELSGKKVKDTNLQWRQRSGKVTHNRNITITTP